MKRNRKLFVATLFFVVLAVIGIAPVNVEGQTDYQDYGSSGSGGSCSYCSSGQCGCSPPPGGMTLYYNCSCSSIQCTRSCSYS